MPCSTRNESSGIYTYSHSPSCVGRLAGLSASHNPLTTGLRTCVTPFSDWSDREGMGMGMYRSGLGLELGERELMDDMQ